MAEPASVETSSSAAAGGKKLLTLNRYKKQWRGRSGVSDRDTIVEFLFTVTPLEGEKPAGPGENFWCEVQLKRRLADRPGWKALGQEDTVKALYAYAVEAMRKAGGRIKRHLTMEWISGAPYSEAPHWDLSGIDLSSPRPVVLDPGEGIEPVVVHQH